MRDFANNIQVKRVISPASVADDTAQVGQIIDRLGYDSLTYLIATGDIADANVTFAVLLEESDAANGAVAGLVGIKGGVVSGVMNLESPGVGAPGRRPRHDER